MAGTAHENFAALIHAAQMDTPDREILVFEGGGTRPDDTRTYADLWRNGQALARGLCGRGIGPGSVIALLMANHAEFVELMVAATLLRVTLVPIDPRTKGDKLAFMIRNSRAQAVVCADYALPNVQALPARQREVDWVAALATDEGPDRSHWGEDIFDIDVLARAKGPDLPVPEGIGEETMQIIHTSGTTGDPKGIVLTHRRFCETAARAFKAFGYLPSDRLYSGLSLTHANALLVTLAPALVGGIPAVFSRRFTRTRLWDITRKYGCTTFTLLGGMTTTLYAQPPTASDADNPVRFVVAAGMSAAIWKQFEQRFGLQILEFYGSAEGGLAVKPLGVGPIGSFGKIVPGFIHRIVQEDDTPVAQGQPGELHIRAQDGSPFQIEYVGNPTASAAKGRGGWLRMGDVVHEDADGWLFFDYRKGGGIRRNGDFITASFVEKAIAESGLVQDVFVYGVPSRSGATGDKDVIAAVVPTDRAFDPATLFRHCRSHLESNFVPSYIQVVAQIPKTASEKPQEHFLVEAFKANPTAVHTEMQSPRTHAATSAAVTAHSG